jgi:hypothetical protein
MSDTERRVYAEYMRVDEEARLFMRMGYKGHELVLVRYPCLDGGWRSEVAPRSVVEVKR